MIRSNLARRIGLLSNSIVKTCLPLTQLSPCSDNLSIVCIQQQRARFSDYVEVHQSISKSNVQKKEEEKVLKAACGVLNDEDEEEEEEMEEMFVDADQTLGHNQREYGKLHQFMLLIL